MAFSTRSLTPHIRSGSTGGNLNVSAGQSASLQARVNEKQGELANLKELRDLSAAVASQMEALQRKLETLSDGTEAIAVVVGNWHNVLRAINMASAKLPKPPVPGDQADPVAEQIPLPQTLVRIPTEHAPALQAQAEVALEEDKRPAEDSG